VGLIARAAGEDEVVEDVPSTVLAGDDAVKLPVGRSVEGAGAPWAAAVLDGEEADAEGAAALGVGPGVTGLLAAGRHYRIPKEVSWWATATIWWAAPRTVGTTVRVAIRRRALKVMVGPFGGRSN